MKKLLTLILLFTMLSSANAQRVLSLDSCRALALRNNKQLNISKISKDVAENTRKAVKTKYLPKVDAVGTYQFTSKEISILSDENKATLTGMGTALGSGISTNATGVITDLVKSGAITMQQAQVFGNILTEAGTSLSSTINQAGQKIVDAFDTDTRNMFMADIVIRQPIYMGGAITAANKIAAISENLAENSIASKTQQTIYDIDQTYWLVVSLKHKQQLADKFQQLVQKLDDDVHKMIKEGIATRADGLSVDVKVNEAEMAKTKVDDGLVLARMLLCQLCGLPMTEEIKLADEDNTDLAVISFDNNVDTKAAIDNRPELKMLRNAVEISEQNTRLVRAAYLPQVAAFGGYMVSNPNVYNGFQRKFEGIFHIGVAVRVPVWSWFEGRYKMNATRAATQMAQLELDEASEKIELQVNQSAFKMKEANKKLVMAKKNAEHAEENLRCANLGFREGVMQSTEVIAAQTAWLEAQTQKIDAEIDVKLSQVNMQKALGTLEY